MKSKIIAPVAWSCFVVGAYALGWWSRPAPQTSGDLTRADSSRAVAGHGTADRTSARTGTPITGKEGRKLVAIPLTTAAITALGIDFRTAVDPLLRREAFAKLLAGLTAENALEIRKQIEHLDADDPGFRDFHFAWGKIGGAEAVLHGAETGKRDMGATLAGWASADPAAARAWFDSLDKKDGKGSEKLKEAFVHGLAIADPTKATEYVMELGAAKDPRAKEMMSIVAEKILTAGGRDSATSWARGLPDGDLRSHALYEIARTQARQDPAAASAWAAPLASGPGGTAMVYGISSEWASRDGAAAAKWLDTLSGNQGASYGPAFAGWAKADPLAASQRINAMPPSENKTRTKPSADSFTAIDGKTPWQPSLGQVRSQMTKNAWPSWPCPQRPT